MNGYIFDTQKSPQKQLCQEKFLIIRKIAKLLLKFTSSFPAAHFAAVHYGSMECDKVLALRFVKRRFDKKIKVSQTGKVDILWWINNIEDSFNFICAIFNKESTGGNFEIDGSLLHINALEMKAVFFGLKSLSSHLRKPHIKMLSHNTTAACPIQAKKFKTDFIRSTLTSYIFSGSLSLTKTGKALGWTNVKAFEKFYNEPVIDNNFGSFY